MPRASVTPTPATRLARLLSGDGPAPRRSGALEVDLADLVVDVTGVGRLGSRVPPAQAKALIALATPAPFGLGTQTLHDARVRDTWQVPVGRVEVDWAGRLDEVLESAGAVLDLPVGTRLGADLHSMLVYEKGQFFRPHQDSEKDGAMVATLVLTLPTRHTGGELVVHDGTHEASYRGSADEVGAVVLYADRLHEVRPVRSGFRISLTFNLLVVEQPDTAAPNAAVEQAAALLDQHFASPWPARWRGEEIERPRRFAYLLDHEYTPAVLSWTRLKGSDVEPARTLRAAIEAGGGEATLALTDIHEVWDADTDDGGWGRHRSRHHEPSVDEVELGSLLDHEVALSHWLLPGSRRAQRVSLGIDDREVAAGTPTVQTMPYAAEYEGYMGNYGNTVDRWYHRAAVLVWPATLAFANRAEASPAAALEDLARRASDGDVASASADAVSMEDFWAGAVRGDPDESALFDRALDVAARLDAGAAEVLLNPFALTSLRPESASAITGLAAARGPDWMVEQLTRWHAGTRAERLDAADWVADLPELTTALHTVPGAAVALLDLVWGRLEARLQALAGAHPTAFVVASLDRLTPPVAAVLEASARAELPQVRDRVLGSVTTHDLLPVALGLLRGAQSWPAVTRRAAAVGRIAWYAVERLRAELACPPRADDDWSMSLPTGCACPTCARLGTFLADRSVQALSWPLVQQGRDHVDSRLQAAELPVSRRTLKQGRPYTLELTKTPALFEREAHRRRQAEADLVAVADLLASWT